MTSQTSERIKLLRTNILILNSIKYYMAYPNYQEERWDNLVSELTEYQDELGYRWFFYDTFFEEWDGKCGHHFPNATWIQERAAELMKFDTNKALAVIVE